jgi:hypothetical protein
VCLGGDTEFHSYAHLLAVAVQYCSCSRYVLAVAQRAVKRKAPLKGTPREKTAYRFGFVFFLFDEEYGRCIRGNIQDERRVA